jgi:hypothetical protein
VAAVFIASEGRSREHVVVDLVVLLAVFQIELDLQLVVTAATAVAAAAAVAAAPSNLALRRFLHLCQIERLGPAPTGRRRAARAKRGRDGSSQVLVLVLVDIRPASGGVQRLR